MKYRKLNSSEKSTFPGNYIKTISIESNIESPNGKFQVMQDFTRAEDEDKLFHIFPLSLQNKHIACFRSYKNNFQI